LGCAVSLGDAQRIDVTTDVARRARAASTKVMRCGWLVALLLVCAGCATNRAPNPAPSDYEFYARFVWPEWTPTVLGLVESTDLDGRTVMISYARRAPDAGTAPGAAMPVSPPAVATSSGPAVAPPSPEMPKTTAPAPTPTGRGAIEYVDLGKKVTFAASADGSPPLRFEWRRNGRAIPGETAAQIIIKAARESDAGTYDCIVQNSAGQAVSEPVTLVVRKP
jgi:hypothetical protein